MKLMGGKRGEKPTNQPSKQTKSIQEDGLTVIKMQMNKVLSCSHFRGRNINVSTRHRHH